MAERRRRRGLLLAFLAALLAAGLASAVTRAEVTETPDSVITFNSEVLPRALPREGTAPVSIRIEGHVKPKKGRRPAPLRRLELAINRAATVTRRGLPVCEASRIDPGSSSAAMAACGGARIGYGRIQAESKFPGQPRFVFDDRVILFNGRLDNGRPAILVHAFNAKPPASSAFAFTIKRRPGLYGTVISADVGLSRFTRVTGFELVINRTFHHAGKRRSFLNAGCPAPKGFSVGISPFVRATLGFGDGSHSQVSVVSSCRVAG